MGNPIYDLSPSFLRSIKRGIMRIRAMVASKEYNTNRADIRLPDATVSDIRVALGNAHFTNAWELSWHYKGEKLNMRRPLRKDDEYEWYQTHVRAFKWDGDIYLEVHEDLEPTEYPYYHLHGAPDSTESRQNAIEDTTAIFDEVGIGYEVL